MPAEAAASAYLGRYRGQTRLHTESDLRVFLREGTEFIAQDRVREQLDAARRTLHELEATR